MNSVFWVHSENPELSWDFIQKSTLKIENESKNGVLKKVLSAEKVNFFECLQEAFTPLISGETPIFIFNDSEKLLKPEIIDELESLMTQESFFIFFRTQSLDFRTNHVKKIKKLGILVTLEPLLGAQRREWILSQAKRNSISLNEDWLQSQEQLENWSQESCLREIEKKSILNTATLKIDTPWSAFHWIEFFLDKKIFFCLNDLDEFADDFNSALPLIGLLTWHLSELIQPTSNKTKSSHWSNWRNKWRKEDLLRVTYLLHCLDKDLKSKSIPSKLLWGSFVTKALSQKTKKTIF